MMPHVVRRRLTTQVVTIPCFTQSEQHKASTSVITEFKEIHYVISKFVICFNICCNQQWCNIQMSKVKVGKMLLTGLDTFETQWLIISFLCQCACGFHHSLTFSVYSIWRTKCSAQIIYFNKVFVYLYTFPNLHELFIFIILFVQI